MNLADFWFIVIAVIWAGFFLLEGFDFGVGMLHRLLGRNEEERAVVVETIGPWWDGNEVWLIVGGAAVFAAFPSWYATWFSAGYLALLLVLAALIARGVAIEYGGRARRRATRNAWSWGLTVGSGLAPLLLGVALGDLLAGLPIDADEEFTGKLWDLLTPYGLLSGLTVLVLCLLHGATFVGLRTTATVRDRAHRAVALLVVPAVLLLLIAFGVATLQTADQGLWRGLLLPLVAAVSALLAGLAGRAGSDRRGFVASSVAMVATVATIFVNLYPNVMKSSTAAANSLTVESTASADYALTVMTWAVVLALPVVLAYQAWSFWVFRRRLQTPAAS